MTNEGREQIDSFGTGLDGRAVQELKPLTAGFISKLDRVLHLSPDYTSQYEIWQEARNAGYVPSEIEVYLGFRRNGLGWSAEPYGVLDSLLVYFEPLTGLDISPQQKEKIRAAVKGWGEIIGQPANELASNLLILLLR